MGRVAHPPQNHQPRAVTPRHLTTTPAGPAPSAPFLRGLFRRAPVLARLALALLLLVSGLAAPTAAQQSGDIRLCDSSDCDSSNLEGALQFYHNGQWGAVCDDSFQDLDATVACSQLGFAGGEAITTYMRNSDTWDMAPRYWLDDLGCSGIESRLTECRHAGVGRHNCSPRTEQAGMRCSNPVAVDVEFDEATYMLDEGSSVEVTVTLNTDPERTLAIPLVATDSQGLSVDAPESVTFEGGGDLSKIITVSADDVVFTMGRTITLGFGLLPLQVSAGTKAETVITVNEDDAPPPPSLAKEGDLRLFGGSDYHEGALQVYHDGQWGAVCDDAFDNGNNGAMVACSQLGLTGGTFNGNFRTSAATWPGRYLLDDVRCTGSESRLTECSHAGFTRNNCSARSEQAGVTCSRTNSVDVKFERAGYTLEEGESVEVTVTLSAAPGRALTIPLVATDNQGLPFNAPESVTFGSSETSKMITVSVVDDLAFTSDPRMITLGFGLLPLQVSAVIPVEAQITVNEDEALLLDESSLKDGDLRLVGSSNYYEGALQVFHNGEWGAVCDDRFKNNSNGAMVACRQLGLSGGAYNSAFESSAEIWPGRYWLDDVICAGSESRLADCSSNNYRSDLNDCREPPSEQAGVTCSQASSVDVGFDAATYTLDEGSTVDVTVMLSAAPGRELTIPLVGTDNQGLPFDAPESVTFQSTETSKMITVSADDVVFTSEVRTITLGFDLLPLQVSAGTNTEAMITVNEDDAPPVPFQRDGDLRLVGGETYNEGALQVFYDGQWGAVCDDRFEDNDNGAMVACRQLGLTGGTYNSAFESSAEIWPGRYWFDDVRCDGSESRLTECLHVGFGFDNCSPQTEQAGVTCDVADALNIEFGAATYALEEGSTVEVTVTLSAAPGRALTIPLIATEDPSFLFNAPESVAFASNETSKTITVSVDDDDFFAPYDRTITLGFGSLPLQVSAGNVAEAVITVKDDDISGLTEARRESAATLLRRYADRFASISSGAALTRLQGLAPPTTVNAQISALSHKVDAGWTGEGAKDSGWSGWSRLFYGWVEGPGDGAVYDLYLGVDWRAPDGRYVIGGLLGHEGADLRLDDGEGRFRSQISMIGIYGATYLSDALILDGALAYGFGRPELSQDGVTAKYETERFTIRADLTGGISWSEGAVVVEPQAGVLHVWERLGAFTDSKDASGAAETLRLTRLGFGPRLTWALPRGTFTGRARLNWDWHNLDGDGDKVSDISASLDARLRYHLEGGLSAEFFGAADGIGLSGDQQTYTAGVSVNFRF